MNKRYFPLFVIAAVWLAFFAVWLGNLGYPELTEEEAFVDILASRPAGEILHTLQTDEPHPPLYYLIMHGWDLLGGSRNEYLVRFPSIALGLILLSLTYRLGRATGLGWRAAVIAAVWLGLSAQLTYHVREARMYVLMAVTATLVVLVALRFDRFSSRRGIVIATVVTFMGLMSHYFNVFFVGVVTICGTLMLHGRHRRRWLLTQVVAWGLFGLWTIFMGQAFLNPASLNGGKAWSFTLPPWETLAGLVRSGLFGYRDVPDTWLVLMGSMLLIGAWLTGIFLSHHRSRWLLVSLVAVPLVLYALAGWLKPIYHPKYMLPWLVFVAIAWGWLVTRRPRLGSGVLILTLIIMMWPTWKTIQMPYYFPSPVAKVPRNDWLKPIHRQMEEHLDRYAGATDTFGLGVPSLIDCYYASFYKSRQMECNLLLQHSDQPLDEVEQQLTDLLNQHQVLWYRELHNAGWDPNDLVAQALSQRAIKLGAEGTVDIPLQLYTSPETILSQQQSVGVRFGEVAELEGIWLIQREHLYPVLVWRSLANHPPVSAKVFVHLVDAEGNILAQMDNVPVSWTRPLDTWKMGEQLIDVYDLSLSASSNGTAATLRIGLYDPDTGARFEAYDSSGTMLPDNVLTIPVELHGRQHI